MTCFTRCHSENVIYKFTKKTKKKTNDRKIVHEQQRQEEKKEKKATKKVVKKVAKAGPVQKSPAKDLAKSEPAKQEPTNVSSPEQKTNQSNLLYYILGLLTLGLIPAYFYFRNKSRSRCNS